MPINPEQIAPEQEFLTKTEKEQTKYRDSLYLLQGQEQLVDSLLGVNKLLDSPDLERMLSQKDFAKILDRLVEFNGKVVKIVQATDLDELDITDEEKEKLTLGLRDLTLLSEEGYKIKDDEKYESSTENRDLAVKFLQKRLGKKQSKMCNLMLESDFLRYLLLIAAKIQEKENAFLARDLRFESIEEQNQIENYKKILKNYLDDPDGVGNLDNLNEFGRQMGIRMPIFDRVVPDEIARNLRRGETREQIGVEIIVQNAKNPYAEALRENYQENVLEQTERRINLISLKKLDQDSYQASGLNRWSQAIESISDDRLNNLSPEKRRILEQEIKAGAIAIFMPGKQVQLETTITQIKASFKPQWIKEGQLQNVSNSYVWEYTESLIQRRALELVKDIPENPYILLIRPTQRPDARTCSKTLEQQKQEFALINQERQQQNLSKVFIANLFEYSALQKRFTEQLNQDIPNLNNLSPLDRDTWIRFLDLPLSSGGDVPGADWDSVDRRLLFGRGDPGFAYPSSGFRLSVRIEI